MPTGLKAFNVFPGEIPSDGGCVLVFAPTRNKARSMTARSGPWLDVPYNEFRAWRVPAFDQYAVREKICETQEELPLDAPQFWSDSV
jgi:hypothetical protein